MDCSPPGRSDQGDLQARILEWVACPPPGDLPDVRVKPASPASPALQADSLPTELPGKPNPYHKVDNFHEKELRLREIQIPWWDGRVRFNPVFDQKTLLWLTSSHLYLYHLPLVFTSNFLISLSRFLCSVQFSSVAQSCLTLCDCMDCTTPGFPVHHQLQSLLKPMSIEPVMPSNRLIRCCPLLLLPSIIPNIRVFSNFYVKYCLKFPPWGVGAGGRKGTSFLLPVCIPISLSHTQVHLTLNHPQARTFQCCDLPQNKDIFLSTKLRSDCPN